MRVPKFRRNPDGRAFAQYPGTKKREYFGKFDDPESLKKYKSWVARLLTTDPATAQIKPGPNQDISSLSVQYLEYAEGYLKGKGDWPNVRGTQVLLDEFAGDILGNAFGPNELRGFQRFLINGGLNGERSLSRKTINAHVGRVRRFFRWLQSRELIPPGRSADLKAVPSLMPGRTEAVESDGTDPVAWSVVEKTIAHLPPNLVIAVKVQYLCGMRPAEVLKMRAGEFDKKHTVWMWRPDKHKTSHRGKKLTKAIPVAAQDVLAPLLESKANGEFLFCPSDAKEWKLSQRKRRRTKIWPCELQRVRDKAALTRRRHVPPAYTSSRYYKEVMAAIEKANKDVPADRRIPHWTPLQLRHAIATEVSALLGEQAAQRWLGHSRLETTAIYTAAHEGELRDIAEKLQPHLPK